MIIRYKINKYRFDDRIPPVLKGEFVRETEHYYFKEGGGSEHKSYWRFESEERALQVLIETNVQAIESANRAISRANADINEAKCLLAKLEGGAA